MKKTTALLLALLILVSLAPAALAENVTPGATTLTTEVPAASYVLNIPADATVPFGSTEFRLENLTVSESANFAEGKNLEVSVSYGPFTCTDVNTTIPYTLYQHATTTSYGGGGKNAPISSGSSLTFVGLNEGTLSAAPQHKDTDNYTWDTDYLYIKINSTDWGKALAGKYSSAITFTAQVVVEG